MNPLAIATKGKGLKNMLRRAQVITSRYGVNSQKMDDTLKRFARVLQTYGASATFPITAVSLQRNKSTIQTLADQGIEFAIHGYTHVDHSLLTATEQIARLSRAISIFEKSGIPFKGFRCPYLRWNQDTLTALRHHHLLYDSSEGLTWDVVDGFETPAYQRVVNFYGAQSAHHHLALPYLEEGLIRIPYCLPDDEGLIDRLYLQSEEVKCKIWLDMFQQIYSFGELFTIGLHPERIDLLTEPLTATLAQARTLSPAVWIARLDEIASWWLERLETQVTFTPSTNQNSEQVTIKGSPAVTILARNLPVSEPAMPWAGNYNQLMTKTFEISSTPRPIIGISPQCPKALVDFLWQQGYLFEINEQPRNYSFYLDRSEFKPEDKRPLLTQIEQGNWPLLRLGRWPHGAQSALCVTGDIDALTVWDYSLRFLGH